MVSEWDGSKYSLIFDKCFEIWVCYFDLEIGEKFVVFIIKLYL